MEIKLPYIRCADEARFLHRGNPSDMIPFLAIRHHEGEIILQIPGGGSISITPSLGFELCNSILDMISEALKYEKENISK